MANRGNAARQPAEDADRLANAFQQAFRQLNGQRDQFKSPKFDGSEDVEMFIQKYTDVAQANNWDPRVAHLNLRLSLEKQAQECARGETVEAIFVNLRARFGLTERQARDKLTTMRKEPGQKFHSLGVEILKLTRIAYPDMGGAHIEVIAMESVRRCIENKHLIRHLMTLNVNNVADLCRACDDYIQAGSNLRQRPQINVTSYDGNSDSDNDAEYDCNAVGVNINSTGRDLQNRSKANATESATSEISKQTDILSKIMGIMDRNTKAIEKLMNYGIQSESRKCFQCGSSEHLIRDSQEN